jgi:hypothetical protein
MGIANRRCGYSVINFMPASVLPSAAAARWREVLSR